MASEGRNELAEKSQNEACQLVMIVPWFNAMQLFFAAAYYILSEWA
jgi:hypothetical protein